MNDPEIDALLRRGEIEQAAALAKRRGFSRKAAELLALAGRHAEGVLCAFEAGERRLALDLAFASGDEQIVAAIADELAKHTDFAAAAAAQARVANRIDIAARVLEPSAPAEAAANFYEIGDYARAGYCWDRAGETTPAMRAFEQHLSQFPDDSGVAERLAELRAGRGDDDGAVRALQAAVRGGAGASALCKLVDGLLRLGLEGSARAVIRKLRAMDPAAPEDPRAYVGQLPASVGAERRYAGRYRMVREVGSGASGRVLEAVDELTGESVALKVLSVGDDRAVGFARFMREAELARVLDDPTLVRMRALDPEGPTIVYDWMPGGTLAERIDSLSIAEVRAIAMRLLAALGVLHRNGVVHRDLKPSNVLFDPAGQARLGDLGAAHLSDLGTTVTGGLVGSLPYMAPEQITAASVSAATDLYAFGCVFYQMLTGKLPFLGPDFVSEHLSGSIPLVSDARPALGVEYDSVIAALLAKDSLARPQDVNAARDLLSVLPWSEPDEREPTLSRPSSIAPEPADEEGQRLVPSATEGRWTDTRLGREIELVIVPRARREQLIRWAAASWTDLQAVYEVYEEGEQVVAWVEPIAGEILGLDDLPGGDRERIERALAAVGLENLGSAVVPVVRNPWSGTVAPLASLLIE